MDDFNSAPKNSNELDLETVLGILLFIFVGYLIFNWIFGTNDSTSSTYIDCSKPGMEFNKYCNGSFEYENRAQNARENNYYQNIVR